MSPAYQGSWSKGCQHQCGHSMIFMVSCTYHMATYNLASPITPSHVRFILAYCHQITYDIHYMIWHGLDTFYKLSNYYHPTTSSLGRAPFHMVTGVVCVPARPSVRPWPALMTTEWLETGLWSAGNDGKWSNYCHENWSALPCHCPTLLLIPT